MVSCESHPLRSLSVPRIEAYFYTTEHAVLSNNTTLIYLSNFDNTKFDLETVQHNFQFSWWGEREFKNSYEKKIIFNKNKIGK